MAIIKSYTDLQQSRKMAEFLPLESADMFLAINGTIPVMAKYIDDGLVTADDTAIPCWSLAALLDVLPQSIKFKGDNYYLRFMKEYVEYGNDAISITGRCLHTTGNDNLVDACYKMILKLHELKMLYYGLREEIQRGSGKSKAIQ